jgi:amidohydrolase
MNVDTLKDEACAAVERLGDTLVGISHQIHARPELAFEERQASKLLARAAEGHSLQVERGAYGLPTAFRARAGSARGPHVIICCEYDALPDLGHACGHNVVAAAGLGAGLALAPLVGRLDGRLTVQGTPAEERGGGKVLLLRRGAFSGAAAVLLVHPSTSDTVLPPIRAAARINVTYHGRSAHTGLAPQLGRNALDALVLAYQATSALRSAIPAGDQVAGTIVHGGGPPNIVPAEASGAFILRSTGGSELRALARKVCGCLEAGALATGCGISISLDGPVYRELRPSLALAAIFHTNVVQVRRQPGPLRQPGMTMGGSTDLGNVSLRLPTIHPKLAIAPASVPEHTPGFARYAILPAADRAVLDGAKSMAMTAIDVWASPTRSEALRPNAVARMSQRHGRDRK